jgi:Icc protein
MSGTSSIRPRRPISRRDFLRVGGLAGAASLAAACGVPATEQAAIPTPAPTQVCPTPAPTQSAGQPAGEIALRIAQISDMHIGPYGPEKDGFARAFRNIQARVPKMDLILNAGDSIGDALGSSDKKKIQADWDAFTGVVKAECSLPIHHAIGNHDVWGWGLSAGEQAAISSDPLFGKGWAVKDLGLPDRYYSFDNAGWRFLVLDSAQRPDPSFGDTGPVYIGQLDEGQYTWLAQQLEATPEAMPVCLLSHIPLLSACELLDGHTEWKGNWIVAGANVHYDARKLVALFMEHTNVRLCLSGHTHQVEDVRYHAVRYISDGAICGNFWNQSDPAFMGFPPGYVAVNLYKDGSSDSEFVAYA